MTLLFALLGMSCAKASDTNEYSALLPVPRVDVALSDDATPREAVFASGCFWCTEAVFLGYPGVLGVVPGYSGGSAETANYEQVSTGTTAHAEAIRVTYDPSRVTYGALLRLFFATHDPTQLNRQGPDHGPQYRSAIFYADADEKRLSEAYIQQLTEAGEFDQPIVTTLEPLVAFYVAEDYHHDYARRNPRQPYIQAVAVPKVIKAQKYIEEATTRPATQPAE